MRDPRTLVTPDAFEIAPSLLGLPLASPWRRLGAILVDLAVIGILTAVLSGAGLLLWGAVAAVLLFIAFRRPERRSMGAHAALLLRLSVGCLGAFILLIVLVVFGAVVWSGFESRGTGPLADRDEPIPGPVRRAVEGALGGGDVDRVVADALSSADGVTEAAEDLADADDEEEAEAAAVALLDALPREALSREAALEMLLDMTPPDAEWRGGARKIYDRALDSVMVSSDTVDAPRGPGAGTPTGAATAGETPDVAALSLEEALAEYARVREAGGGAEAGRERALRRRLALELGSDTVRSLHRELEREREERRDAEREAERLSEEGGGMVALLRNVWDQLGSAIGLWSIYFTVLLTLTRGRTLGKKIFGLRVLRLDGEPLTWWTSFERGGGYAAGIATGLLGFAQVFWDANRQCVHDRIVGTVVVLDGARPLPFGRIEARPTTPRAGGSAPSGEGV